MNARFSRKSTSSPLKRQSSAGRLSSVLTDPAEVEKVRGEVEALRKVLQSASYMELESAFHDGMRKQVGALQLSHLFSRWA